MELKKLFTMQEALDKHIQTQHNLDTTKLFNDKLLALLVELSELANETRCFKFWSKKAPSERNVVLEEYVDSIHFLLSLGIAKDLTSFNNWEIVQPTASMTQLFLTINEEIISFGKNPTMQSYTSLWAWYGQLASALGFQAEEIIDAYIKKNEKNYDRQNSGY